MKKSSLIALAFLLFICPFAFAQGNKYALLIAIGDYPEETKWKKINSLNDIKLVKEVLLNKGFSEDHIFTLTDHDATREGILKSIDTNLKSRVMPGDIVYFQFSGHGQQVVDDNGDEVDGFDEALVPINSPMVFEEGVYEGENLIRDEVIGAELDAIRKKIGPSGNLLTVLDACHSGTGTRGMAVARGTDHVMGDPRKVADLIGQKKQEFTFKAMEESGLAPWVAFFGASANQLNFEASDDTGKPCGSLTYAFCKKMAAAGPNTTYRALFDQVRLEMSNIAPRQQPHAEGVLDQQVFGGNLLETPKYMRVLSWEDPTSITIDAGWMQNMNEQTVVGLYPPDTRNITNATPMVKGKITLCQPFQSVIQLESNIEQKVAQTAWVYILEESFGDIKVKVDTRLPADHPIQIALAAKAQKISAIQFDQNAPQLYLALEDNQIKLYSSSNFMLDSLAQDLAPAVASSRLVRKMLDYAQAGYMRSIEMANPDLKLKLEIIPVDLDQRTMKSKGDIPIAQKTDASGTLRFKKGDVFRLRITNTGERTAYYTLLDIQPDNVINVMLPGKDETPSEFRIVPEQVVDIPTLFRFSEPFGTEMFKLISTDQPIDLRRIAASRGEGIGTRANLNPLERLFAETYLDEETGSRGPAAIGVASGSMHSESINFIIEK